MINQPENITGDIEKARRLNQTERFRQLGVQLRAEGLAADDDDTPDEERGRRFFERASAEFQEQVCGNQSIKKLVKSTLPQDQTKIALLIFDIFSSAVGAPPAALLTAEVLERGVRLLCREIWQNDNSSPVS